MWSAQLTRDPGLGDWIDACIPAAGGCRRWHSFKKLSSNVMRLHASMVVPSSERMEWASSRRAGIYSGLRESSASAPYRAYKITFKSV